MTVSHTCLVFDDVDSLKEYWSGVLHNVPQVGFVLLFFLRLDWSLIFKLNI